MDRCIENYDFLYKIVMVGDSGVGKTGLVSRHVHGDFELASKSTIGVELSTSAMIYDHKCIKTQIWDTAGQERFKAITSAYYRGAHGIIFAYDITNRDTYKNLEKWYEELYPHQSKDTVCILVGNKSDLEHLRTVSMNEAKSYAEYMGFLYMETSALSDLNVGKVFETLIIEIYKKYKVNMDGHKEILDGCESVSFDIGKKVQIFPKSCCFK